MTSRTRFALASFLLALLAGAFTAFAPLGQRCSATSTGTPERCIETSIFQQDGAWILVVVAVPIVVALVPVLIRHRVAAIISAALLWGFCLLGLASIGWFFVPAAVAMTIAAARRDPVPASV